MYLILTVQQSTTDDNTAGYGVLEAKPRGRRSMLGYYYMSFLYGDIKDEPQKTGTFREGVMGITGVDFSTWTMQLGSKMGLLLERARLFGTSPILGVLPSPVTTRGTSVRIGIPRVEGGHSEKYKRFPYYMR